ncbi:N(4)-(beta-N-acetylglucosaminyl)-L-asparaginase [Flavobacteriaceae bacterium]|nr:N(4)-(beta-N-acetylglucosaminyl)-L-asparaginase [Flavobacteriaceae bacterium]MDB9912252.1 N(4)-(beta-N-acetylglucosaminyl)-L-asparaginase [Flavobacteriaceae bacterium]
MKRRNFLQKAALGSVGITALGSSLAATAATPKGAKDTQDVPVSNSLLPVVIATWSVKQATKKAWQSMEQGSSALDAVIAGCGVEEANALGQSVGIGGLPDRDGQVTLDACVMNEKGDYGAVLCMQNIKHPIAVAKKVMEDTPHVILAGVGAEEFAVSQGFKRENLLTEQSKKDWEIWKKTSKYKPIINIENHDTIGMLAIDKNGTISGGCTTSGLAYKMSGRVGDSAIVGSGLFVDNEIGAATATGLGEEVLKTVGSYLIVELIRQGKSPQEACELAILRIIEKTPNFEDFQVGYIAVNKKGETGAYSIHEGFTATTYQDQKNTTFNPNFYNKK